MNAPDPEWQATRKSIHDTCDQLKSQIQQSNVGATIGVEFVLFKVLYGSVYNAFPSRDQALVVLDHFMKEENLASTLQDLRKMYQMHGFVRTAQDVWEAWHPANAFHPDTLGKITLETAGVWFEHALAAMQVPADSPLTSAIPIVTPPSSPAAASASEEQELENVCDNSACPNLCAKPNHVLCQACHKAKRKAKGKGKGKRKGKRGRNRK